MDSTGNTKLNSYQYDMWGNIVSQQENLPQPFKYSGEMMDDKDGLQYLRARWYDPSMGRFVGEDTFGGQINNPLSLNRFTYVSNNPLIYTDPSGHEQTGDKELLGSGYKDIERLTGDYQHAIDNGADPEWAHDYYHGLAEVIRNQNGAHTEIINGEEVTVANVGIRIPSDSEGLPSSPLNRVSITKSSSELIQESLDDLKDPNSEMLQMSRDIVIEMYTGGVKGKSFRGGTKSTRDNWYGYNDKDFQNWWHRQGKREFGGNDIEDANKAKEAYDYSVEIGKPNKNRK